MSLIFCPKVFNNFTWIKFSVSTIVVNWILKPEYFMCLPFYLHNIIFKDSRCNARGIFLVQINRKSPHNNVAVGQGDEEDVNILPTLELELARMSSNKMNSHIETFSKNNLIGPPALPEGFNVVAGMEKVESSKQHMKWTFTRATTWLPPTWVIFCFLINPNNLVRSLALYIGLRHTDPNFWLWGATHTHMQQ